MKGHEIINHIVRAKMPDREQVRENCIHNLQMNDAKRPFLHLTSLVVTTAVVLICFLLGSMILNLRDNKKGNLFSVKAYALEQQANGSITLRDYYELNSYDEKTVLGLGLANSDGSFYGGRGIYFEFNGENIKNVEFIVEEDDAMFVLAHVLKENGQIVMNDMGSFNSFTVKSWEYLNKSFTLDSMNSFPEDSLLFVGKSYPDGNNNYKAPLNLTIRAIATFNDGTTQEEKILIN
ncbi:MAG: hypothetical protein FWC47_02345 [Oscillospiraceae bacterium]|nr:hypothetical protein [Oscillospiraceae bacterium]